MARTNNMKIRTVIGDDGTIVGFDLSNYSGGGNFLLRLHRLGEDWYWVLEGNGYRGTLLMSLADTGLDDSDLDELGMAALKLCRTENGLEERDALLRRRFEARTGETLPRKLPHAREECWFG